MKRRAGTGLVERFEKGIVRLVEHHGGVQAGAETLGERGLAEADGSFDGEVSEVHASEVYQPYRFTARGAIR